MNSFLFKLKTFFSDKPVIKRDTVSEMYDRTLYSKISKHYNVTTEIAKEYCDKVGKIHLYYSKKGSVVYNSTLGELNTISRRHKIEKLRNGYKR